MEEGTDVIKLKKKKNQAIVVGDVFVLGIFFWYVEFTDVFMSKSIACDLYRKALLQNS